MEKPACPAATEAARELDKECRGTPCRPPHRQPQQTMLLLSTVHGRGPSDKISRFPCHPVPLSSWGPAPPDSPRRTSSPRAGSRASPWKRQIPSVGISQTGPLQGLPVRHRRAPLLHQGFRRRRTLERDPCLTICLTRSRLSRIYYNGKFFAYPLKPFNALMGLGPDRNLSVRGKLRMGEPIPHQARRQLRHLGV